MTPQQFLTEISRGKVEPVYLFLGPEPYWRDRCRRALVERVLPPEEREDGLARHDLSEIKLADALDDARSLSLFAANRLIWMASAEAALPRVLTSPASGDDDEDGGGKASKTSALESYVKSPTPGVTVVFDCSRFDFEGEDKARLQRVEKFYAAIKARVEFAHMEAAAARKLAEAEAKRLELRIGPDELDLLVEILDAEALRLVNEIEKLSLRAGTSRAVTEEDIWQLAPAAKASTIFALAAAIGRGDRTAALESLDILVREGEYLPLALTFLGSQFRQALVAKEAGLRTAGDIQTHFSKMGVAMWRSKAEQVLQTVQAFSKTRLEAAIRETYETDKALRDRNPDDRIVVERFVWSVARRP